MKILGQSLELFFVDGRPDGMVTAEVFNALKDKKTSKGYTISQAIQTGVVTPHLGVGITAGDEESWDLFKDAFYPVIKGWHGFDPATQTHTSDLDTSDLAATAGVTAGVTADVTAGMTAGKSRDDLPLAAELSLLLKLLGVE